MNTPPVDPLIGRLVDRRYLIQHRVARGGMATVYQAMDQRLERPVAIKIMHPHLAEDEDFTRRFIQEARQAARLAHPNIVNVFDQGQEGAVTYIVMEYLPGITLRELLQDFGALTAAQTVDIVKAVLNGLDAAHSAGIVHRDLKPENVLLADDGRIKIADFGLARASTHNTATSQALLGTIAYLSPELIARGVSDVRSDIYALGIMMFEMLTGQQPYQGDQAVTIAYQHANDTVPPPSSKQPGVPARFDEIVLWCVGRSPDDRPPHARALLEHIVELEKELGSEALTQATQVLNETVAMTQKMSPLDVQETEVLDPQSAVFENLEPNAKLLSNDPEIVATPVREKTKKSRAGAWVAVITVLALLVAGGGVTWWTTSGPGAMVIVPTVQGDTVLDATRAIAEAELILSEDFLEEFDLLLPAGTVKGTTPPAGEAVERGSAITLIVSLGPNPVSVPAVTGKTVAEVTRELQAVNVLLGATTEEFNDFVDRGTVLRLLTELGESLPAGSQILAGSTLNAVVSAGTIPDVSGLAVEDARRLLDAVGLQGVVGGDGAFSDTIPEGFVVDIQNLGTSTLAPGDSLTLRVSRGPELIEIPDVIGDTIASAKTELEALGFEVQVDSRFSESDWDRDIAEVTSSNPTAGKEVPRGSTIVLRGLL